MQSILAVVYRTRPVEDNRVVRDAQLFPINIPPNSFAFPQPIFNLGSRRLINSPPNPTLLRASLRSFLRSTRTTEEMGLLDITLSEPLNSKQVGLDGQGMQGSSGSSSPPSSYPSNGQESATSPSLPETADTAPVLAPLPKLMPGINRTWTGDGGGSDDDDDYQVWNINPENPRKITERRRADNALFQSWIRKNQDDLAKQKPKPAQDPQFMSAARMVKENHNKKIIQSPREYQIELFERAKKRNTIVVLGTGKIG